MRVELVRRGPQVTFFKAQLPRGEVGIEVKLGGLGTEQAMDELVPRILGQDRREVEALKEILSRRPRRAGDQERLAKDYAAWDQVADEALARFR